MAGSNAPTIIKRKKIVVAGAHHGGAWKVAYADFVTAMMAFFMLMWLLNATTEKQRKGIADYFNPTIPVNRISGGGEGAFSGDSIFAEETLARNGTGASSLQPTERDLARGETGVDRAGSARDAAEDAAFRDVQERILGKGGDSMASELLARHVVTRLTDEGLIVEIFDIDGAPLFAAGTAEPEPVLGEIAAMLVRVFALVKNDLAIGGHVAAQPEPLRVDRVWSLSTARAAATRELLEAAGLAPARVARQVGHADRRTVAPNPMAMRNNRLELVLLRSDTG